MSLKNKNLFDYLQFLKKQPRGFYYQDTLGNNRSTLRIAAASGSSPKSEYKSKKQRLNELFTPCVDCQKCPLAHQGRTQVVFGAGNAEAKLMFVGEGPGRDEDIQGSPFVGRAGQLLNKIIEAMGLKREEVYISNAVKCRPPNNRTPLPIEVDTCKNLLLLREIEIIQPQIICTLGSPATKALLGDHVQISRARGVFSEFKEIPVMPTYHPAYLLRNPIEKRTVWEDMKKIMAKLEELKTP
jgi:DNA polymerase